MPCGVGRRSAARVLAQALRARGVPSAGLRPARAAYGGGGDWRVRVASRVSTPDAGVKQQEEAASGRGKTLAESRCGGVTARCGGWFCGRRRGKVGRPGGVVGGSTPSGVPKRLVFERLRDAAHDVQSRWDEEGRLRHHEVVRGIFCSDGLVLGRAWARELQEGANEEARAAELRRGGAGGSTAVAEGRLGRRGVWLAAPPRRVFRSGSCSYDFVMPRTTRRVVGTRRGACGITKSSEVFSVPMGWCLSIFLFVDFL